MLSDDPSLIGFHLWDGPRRVPEERKRAGAAPPCLGALRFYLTDRTRIRARRSLTFKLEYLLLASDSEHDESSALTAIGCCRRIPEIGVSLFTQVTQFIAHRNSNARAGRECHNPALK
jgi:hypothetical protein